MIKILQMKRNWGGWGRRGHTNAELICLDEWILQVWICSDTSIILVLCILISFNIMRQVNLYFAIYFFFMSMREYYLFKHSTAAAQLAQIHLFQPFFFLKHICWRTLCTNMRKKVSQKAVKYSMSLIWIDKP